MAGASRTRAPASANYVEYEEYVDFQLEKTRAIVKRTDILTTLMALAVGVIGYLLAFVVCDQWLINGGFGYTSRVVLLAIVVAAVVGTLAWRVVLPLLRQVHPLYAARVIEQSDPQFKSNLVNFVDVKLANAESSPGVMKSMQKRAAVELSHIDVEEAVDHRPLLRIAYVLLGVVIVSALYIWQSPKDVFVSVRRALFPTSSLAVATKTTIINVDPGDKDVPARTRQLITAELYGEEADQAQILFTTADHKYVDEPVKMRRETLGLPKFLGELNGENGKGLLQSLRYRIVAGDARSTDYAISVIQPPSARVDEVHYVFPNYTELPETTALSGDIDGWEGTEVIVKATANMKVARAAIVLTDSDDKTEKGETVSMQVTDGTMLTGKWKLEFRSDGTAPKFYHIQVTTENQKKDEIDSDPTQYALRIRPDQRPDVALLDPTGDLTKPANAIIPLVVQASDPDFKVRSVILRGARGSDSLFNQDVKLFGDQELPAKSVTGKYNFNLEPLGLKPGETIEFWIEAKDNKQPTANRTNTTRLRVMIDKPVSPEEVQKQLAKDEQNQQDQLARAEQANNPEKTEQDRPETRTGDKREDQARPRQDRNDPGAAQLKDKDEAHNDRSDKADQKRGNNSPDQPRQPLDNDEALSRLLKKQPSADQEDQNPADQQAQNPGEKQEPQGAQDQDPADRSQNDPGAGNGRKGQNQARNQQPKKSDQSPSDRGQPGDKTSDGDRQGNQAKPGDDKSKSNNGEGSKKSQGKNSQGKSAEPKSQPQPGNERNESGDKPGDQPKAGEKSKQPGSSDEKAGGDEQKPDGKTGDKKPGNKKSGDKKPDDANAGDQKDDPGDEGVGQKTAKNDRAMKNGPKNNPAGNDADQPQPSDANSGKEHDGQKKAATNNKKSQNDQGDTDSAQPDSAADQPRKDKSGEQPAANEDGSRGAAGDEQKAVESPDKKKPGAKEGGSGDENQPADVDKGPQQKNKEQGGAGKKPADKTDAGEDGKDKQPSGGIPGQSDKNPGGESEDKAADDKANGDKGHTGDKSKKKGAGPKKPGGDVDPNGPKEPAVDDGTAKDKPATGNEPGEAEGDDRPGNRKSSPAGDNVKKKEGSKPGAKKPGNGDDPQRQNANPKHVEDQGAEGATDDAEKAERPADGKKATEQPGKLDEPPSEKGVKRRDGGNEERPGQPPEGGNQPMKGKGRPQGQKSDQPETGEQGSSAASDQGEPGANKEGPGDKSDEPGNADAANKKTGQPDSGKKGKGSTTKSSDGGEGQKQDAGGDNPGDKGAGQKGKKGPNAKDGKPSQGNESGEEGDGKESAKSGGKQGGKVGGKAAEEGGKDAGDDSAGESGQGQSSQPGKKGKPGQPGSGQQKSGSGVSSVPETGNPSGAGDPQTPDGEEAAPRERTEPPTAEEEAANLENAKKATNLVLKRLKSQLERGEVDQEMLDEMGWKGKQDVEKFVRYLEDNLKQNADDNSPDAQARRMQFEETLRNLEVGSETQRRAGSVGKERAIDQVGAKNVAPPREYQRIWESYTRSLSKQNDKNGSKSKAPDKVKTDQVKKAQ